MTDDVTYSSSSLMLLACSALVSYSPAFTPALHIGQVTKTYPKSFKTKLGAGFILAGINGL